MARNKEFFTLRLQSTPNGNQPLGPNADHLTRFFSNDESVAECFRQNSLLKLLKFGNFINMILRIFTKWNHIFNKSCRAIVTYFTCCCNTLSLIASHVRKRRYHLNG